MRNLEYCSSVVSLMHSILEAEPGLNLNELLYHMKYVLHLQHVHMSYRASIDWFDNSEFYS